MTLPVGAKTICEAAAALAALLAAGFWFAAARCPVAKYAPSAYGDISKAVKPLNDKIQLGATLNGWAATCAAISALFQALALLIGIIWHWLK